MSFVTLTFETSADANTFHEAVCKALQEGDEDAQFKLIEDIQNIVVTHVQPEIVEADTETGWVTQLIAQASHPEALEVDVAILRDSLAALIRVVENIDAVLGPAVWHALENARQVLLAGRAI